MTSTTIGIIGARQIGGAIAQQLARLNIEVTISNSQGPGSLQELVGRLGPSMKAGRQEEAASKDIVFVAVPWPKLPKALAGLPDFGRRIVVDTNDPLQKPPLPSIDREGGARLHCSLKWFPGHAW